METLVKDSKSKNEEVKKPSIKHEDIMKNYETSVKVTETEIELGIINDYFDTYGSMDDIS